MKNNYSKSKYERDRLNTKRSSTLDESRKSKDDEFYTPYEDIEQELLRYPKEFWKDKTILLPCDDPAGKSPSMFVEFFKDNERRLEYKRLICCGFDGSMLDTDSEPGKFKVYDARNTKIKVAKKEGHVKESNSDYLFEYTEKTIGWETEDWNGDFRTNPYWDEADIIVTNPPFSSPIFQEFVEKCIESKKDFVVLSPYTASTYGWFSNYLFDKIYLGFNRNVGISFIRPDRSIKKIGCNWITSYKHAKSTKGKFVPQMGLSAIGYSDKFDNYKNVIKINKYNEFPRDWNGWVLAPSSILDRWDDEVFEYGGATMSSCYHPIKLSLQTKEKAHGPIQDGKGLFANVICRYKGVSK